MNGWRIDTSGGQYGQDYLRRALVAQVGWGENVPQEAVYPRATVASTGRDLDGATRYRIHFAPGQLPPVGAFWSLTLYGPDGFFTANSLDRYAIGDRTPGLTRNPDGSLDLYVQHTRRPEAGQLAACPDRPVQPDDAAVPAEALGARRHLAPSGGHANSVTVRVSTTRSGPSIRIT